MSLTPNDLSHPITPPPELVQQWRKQAPVVLNFRALCVNLLDCLEKADWPPRYRHVFGQWASVARTALAEPVAEPPAVAEQPSDDELGLIYHDCCRGCEFMDQVGFEDAARAVLARWRQPAASPAEGEVAELVAWLHGRDGGLGRRAIYARIAELLERHAAMENLAADAVSGLRYIEQTAGRLYGVGWDRVFDAAATLQPAHALPLPAPQGGEVEP